MRGKRFDLKTTVIVLVVAGLLAVVVVYVSNRYFVPDVLFPELPDR